MREHVGHLPSPQALFLLERRKGRRCNDAQTRPWVLTRTCPVRRVGRWLLLTTCPTCLLCDGGPGTYPLCASASSTGNLDNNRPNGAAW